MSFANAIRIALVVAWLALFGRHALHYALPDLGLSHHRDFAAVAQANLERSFTYLVVEDQDGGDGRPCGSCTLALERDERRYLLTTTLRLTDQRFDAALAALLPPRPGDRRDPHLSATLAETLDEQLRLVGVDADANAHGRLIHAVGHVGGDGLRGTVAIDGAPGIPFTLPEIGAETAQGLDAALSLPPGLQPGESFASTMVNPDLLRLSAHRAVVVFRACTRERARTRHGERDLLRVELEVDGRPFADLWCDERGTVYIDRQRGARWALLLDHVNDLAAANRQLWPAIP